MRALLVLALAALGCSRQESKPDVAPWDQPASAELEAGRTIWLATCKRCHASGKAGSPKFGDKEAWRARLEKGPEKLLERALTGYETPAGNEMPARGGEKSLSDADVKQALDYMLSSVR